MNIIRFLPLVLLFLSVQLLKAQPGNPAQADTASLQVQFDAMIDASNRFQRFRVVRQDFLDAYKANVSDSIEVYTSEIGALKATIAEQKTRIADQGTEISDRDTEIGSLKGEKDSISLLGMQLSKSTYNIALWSIIGILLAGLLFAIARMQVAVSGSRDARVAREKTAEELEKSRKNRLEVEQKLRRQLQDERNKRGGGTE
jgi:chromosome segregation ATPase